MTAATTRVSPVVRPWTKGQIAGCTLVFLVILGGIGWFALRHPSPKPTMVSGSATEASMAALQEGLHQNPNDPDRLRRIADLYFDHQQYAEAASFYRQLLAVEPNEIAVRTNLGLALWQQKDADGALRELQTVLEHDPNFAPALEAYGLVLWQAKHDSRQAVAAWKHLLATNPNYSGRSRVEAMMGAAK